MAGRNVKGRLAQLDGQGIAQCEIQERQLQQQRRFRRVHVANHEAARHGRDGHKHQRDQRLIGQHLQQFALCAHVAEGRGDAQRACHLEHGADCHDKEEQQEIALHEEQKQGQRRTGHTHKRAENQPGVAHTGRFAKQFQHVIEGLEQRRANTGLQTGGELSVKAGKQAASRDGQRERHKGKQELEHQIKPPSISVSRTSAMVLQVRVSVASPNHSAR